MTCDVYPPPYAVGLACHPKASNFPVREVEILLDDRECTFGSTIQGTVKITPRTATTVDEICIVILSRERSGRYGSTAPIVIKQEVASALIPVNERVSAGYCYTVPFSIQFPYLNWIGSCKCGQGHDVLPPSLTPSGPTNVHLHCESSYMLQATMQGRHVAFEYINFQSQSFSECHPEQAVALELPMTLLSLSCFRKPGSLRADILPMVHWGDYKVPGPVDFSLVWVSPQGPCSRSPPTISKVDYRIFRCVRRVTATGKMTQRFLVGQGSTKVKCKWQNSATDLSFNYEFNQSKEPLAVSYSGCLTSVYYTITITVAKVSFSARILVGSDGLPVYAQPVPKLDHSVVASSKI